MTKKICFFNRSSIHYRKNIYMLMDRELPCDFYFGDSRPGGIKPVDTSLLVNYKGTLHNVSLGSCFWQRGALGLLLKGYTDIITPGETYCISTWVLLLLSKLTGKRVYLWTHGAYGDEKGFKKWMTKMRIKLSAGTFLYGTYAKSILEQYGVNPNKLHVIYNSLDYDNQIRIRERLKEKPFYQEHFGNDNANIVFIGRLTAVKKLHQIIEAASILHNHGFKVNVTFIGDGSEKTKLQDKVKEYGLTDNVWFYGACYDEQQISDFIYNADLCVSPGNVGLTAMHAMTFGTPVISHDNFPKQMPEFEAIEAGATGGYFKEDNIESLAASIENWLVTNKDRNEIRKACYRVIDEKYNPHRQVEVMKQTIYK